MGYLIFFSIGILIGLILLVIKKSIYMPKPRTVQAIMMFGKLHTFISNIDGKIIYDGEDDPNRPNGPVKKWDLIDENNKNEYNIYFFLWPFYKVHKFPLTYNKSKELGDEDPNDHIIWQKDNAKEIVVSRSGISDHLEYRVEYPTITNRLNTGELASIDTFSNNILELTNPSLALFGIKNWMGASMEILHGALRTIVAERTLMDLNELSSPDTDLSFDSEMKKLVNYHLPKDGEEEHPNLENIGFKVFKSILKDFDASDSKSQELLDSYANVTIAEETGKAKVKFAEKEADAKVLEAEGEAKALAIREKAIIEWRKKYLVDTGLAKIDSEGKIIELVPDANVKVSADALAELHSITGTLSIGGDLTKILNLNDPAKLNQ